MKSFLEEMTRPVLTIAPAEPLPNAVADRIGPRGRACRERARAIIRAVADYWGLSVRELMAHSRVRRLVWPRQVAMFLIHRRTTMSSPEISKLFLGRDHGTVLHAIHAVEDMMQCYPQVREEISRLEQSL